MVRAKADRRGWADDVAEVPRAFSAHLYLADVGCTESMRPIRVVTKSFAFGLSGPNDANRIIVPRGFCSDGASVPQVFWGFFGNWGAFAQAAIVHDLIYSTHLLKRSAADQLFRKGIFVISHHLDADRPVRNRKAAADLAYWAVRLGGWPAYHRGKEHYARRAWRAKLRAEKLDRGLAAMIITDWRDLIDAQTVDQGLIKRLNVHRWLFRRQS